MSESLDYSAKLRLPADTGDGRDRRRRSSARSRSSGSTEHAETRIGSLSGGQRKRVGVATELLSRPSLLFLDEPTTGLDPGPRDAMMELLRELADNSRAVTVVTHATKSLGLCDKLVVMGARRRAVLPGHARTRRSGSSAPRPTTTSTPRCEPRRAPEWQQQLHRPGPGDAGPRRGATEPARARAPADARAGVCTRRGS